MSISISEVEEALQSLNSDKQAGLDEIPPVILKNYASVPGSPAFYYFLPFSFYG